MKIWRIEEWIEWGGDINNFYFDSKEKAIKYCEDHGIYSEIQQSYLTKKNTWLEITEIDVK